MRLLSPFDRLRALLADVPPGRPPVDLSIGSPRLPPPPFVAEVIARHAGDWGPYPPIAGTAAFAEAVHDWLDRRYGLGGWFREAGGVLPLAGSREGLASAAVTIRDLAARPNPVVLFANPYYAAYPAAALAAGMEPVPLAAAAGVMPDFDRVPAALLGRAVAFYMGSPSNPAGATASRADWHALFDRAERHDFVLFADECYGDIYREHLAPPVGALEAARERPDALRRLVVFNSLSKRSSLAGLRVGFVAAGRPILAALRETRNQLAPHVPVPLMAAAAAAFRDEAHVAAARAQYDAAFAVAERALSPLLGPVTPPGGFCLWLPVGDDVAVAAALWREAGVRVLPGSFCAVDGPGGNPGAGFIRLALVEDTATTAEACGRVATVLARAPLAAKAPLPA